jgi:hypothetical protein
MATKKLKSTLDERTNVNFTMAKEIKDYIREEANKNGVTMSAQVTMIIQESRRTKSSMETLAQVMLQTVMKNEKAIKK